MSLFRKLGVVLALVAICGLVGITVSGPASAAPAAGSDERQECKGPSDLQGETAGPGESGENGLPTELLPIDRWGSGASSLHTRLNVGQFHMSSIPQQATRHAIAPIGMSIGNALWQFSTGMIKFADNFEVLEAMGCTADKSAYALGLALVGGSGGDRSSGALLSLLVVVGLVMVLWRARSGRSPWRDLAKMVGILSIFLILFTGAERTTVTNQISNGSPAWFAMATSDVASAVVRPVVDGMRRASPGPDGISGNQEAAPFAMNCRDYLNALHELYIKDNRRTSAIPIVMSSLWEQSGLSIWVASQFGMKNDYSNYVYCHMLDRKIGVPIQEQGAVFLQSIENGAVDQREAGIVNGSVLAGHDDTIADIAYVFLAACRFDGTQWRRAYGWSEVTNPELRPTPYACESGWLNGPSNATNEPGVETEAEEGGEGDGGGNILSAFWDSATGYVSNLADAGVTTGKVLWSWNIQHNPIMAPVAAGQQAQAMLDGLTTGGGEIGPAGPFNWGYTSATIDQATAGENLGSVADYMYNLHGYAISGAMTLSVIYVIVSFMMLITFGIIALSVIIAKLASLVMIMFVFLALLASVIPTAGPSRASKFFKFWLGTTLYSYLLTIILSLVVIITAFVAASGTAAFGPGSIMATIWLGFAPITAIIVMHMLMKNAVGFSPFKPGAALALGALAGAAGGAAGAGIDRMGRRGASAVRRGISHGLGERAVNRNRYGRGSGTKQGMAPDGSTASSRRPQLTEAQRKLGKQIAKDQKRSEGRGVANRLKHPLSTTGKSMARAKRNAAQKARDARTAFRNRPIRSIAKGVGKGAKWGAVGALALAAPAVTLGGLALWKGGKALRDYRRQNQENLAIHGMSTREKRYADAYGEHVAKLPPPHGGSQSAPGGGPVPGTPPPGSGGPRPGGRPRSGGIAPAGDPRHGSTPEDPGLGDASPTPPPEPPQRQPRPSPSQRPPVPLDRNHPPEGRRLN